MGYIKHYWYFLKDMVTPIFSTPCELYGVENCMEENLTTFDKLTKKKTVFAQN